jgi:myo-inositol-1(or 4)-monophosphatase
MIDRKIIFKAINVATKAHEGQYRKGSNIPYIVHPMECGFIVDGITNNPKLIAAAILHDTIEDTYITYEDLLIDFGPEVADIVQALSEDKKRDRPGTETWKERKVEALNHYKNLDTKTKIVLLSDKLSNIRAMKEDYDNLGEALWQKFNMKDKVEHAWYYGSLALIFADLQPLKEVKEYLEIYHYIFQNER